MKELIQKALKAIGLSEDLWEKITVTSETEIESAVKKLASEQREEKIREVLKKEGLTDDLDKMIESKADQAVTKGIKTYDENRNADAKKKADEDAKAEEAKKLADELAKKKADELKDLEGDKKTIAELQQRLDDSDKRHKELEDQISGVKTTLSDVDRKALITEKIKAAKLNPKFEDYVTETDAGKIETQVNGLKDTYASQKQIDNDALIAAGGKIVTGGGADGFDNADIVAHAQSKTGDVVQVKGRASQQIVASKAAIAVPTK